MALDNIVIDHMDNLAQVFLDDEIAKTMSRCHGRHYPRSQWSRDHKRLAVGLEH